MLGTTASAGEGSTAGFVAGAPEVAALVAGAVAVVAGMVLVVASAVRARRAHRDRARAAAQAGRPLISGPVTVRGTVAPGPDGLVTEPLSGREVVWFRLTSFAPRAAATSQNDHVQVHSEWDARDFLLDDGTRSPALVSVRDAGFVVPMDMYGDAGAVFDSGSVPWTRHQLTAQHVAALRTLSARPTTRMVRADSHSLAPGTAVTVAGWRERGVAGPTLVGRSPDHPLIVYAVGEDEGDSETGRRWRLPAIGTLLVVAGALGIWWSASVLR